MSLLKAEWRKLLMANFEVEASLLQPYVPAKTELDFWNNRCYVSLVGFMFLNTRLLGLPVPFHRHFEEVNLRFYVRSKQGGSWRRGVVFVKEIVPRPALSFVANAVYGEHYETMKMWHSWRQEAGQRSVEYSWRKNGKVNRLYAEAGLEAAAIAAGSEEEFITEHYWGYTKVNNQKTSEYEVVHPQWQCYPVKHYEIDVDFGGVYGHRFAGLAGTPPLSVMLAEGSEISVERKRDL